MNIMKANAEQLFEYGPFTVRRQRPGSAFKPLTYVDQMTLKLDAHIPMQQQQNALIFTYVWRGSLQYQNAHGERTSLSAKRVMLITAGEGLRYEQSVPLVQAEVLQAVMQPRVAGGASDIQLLERAEGTEQNVWTLLAGPDMSAAPMTLDQDILIYDARLEKGHALPAPALDGYEAWITVLDGVISIAEQRFGKGDAVSAVAGNALLKAEREARLVCFLVKADAPPAGLSQ